MTLLLHQVALGILAKCVWGCGRESHTLPVAVNEDSPFRQHCGRCHPLDYNIRQHGWTCCIPELVVYGMIAMAWHDGKVKIMEPVKRTERPKRGRNKWVREHGWNTLGTVRPLCVIPQCWCHPTKYVQFCREGSPVSSVRCRLISELTILSPQCKALVIGTGEN